MTFIPKIFATGATGYVGGDVLWALLRKYPTWESNVTALVRDRTNAKLILEVFPRMKIVYGSLDDEAILEEESAKADIIMNWASSDHPSSAEAIARGVLAAKGVKDHPTYLIHTSGTGILTWKTVETKRYGDLEAKIYDDWEGISEVTSFPDHAAHRDTDKIVLTAGTRDDGRIKTAIVCPPTIYGVGRGPVNKRSMQLYDLAKMTLVTGKGMHVGQGNNEQTHVHLYDLTKLYILLIEAAVAGGGNATWGEKGYYFGSRGPQVWGKVAQAIAKEAFDQGLIESDQVVEFTDEELTRSAGHSHAALIFGGNAREKSVRAARLLGWTPSHGDIFEEVPAAVASEAARLGKTGRSREKE